MDDALVDLQTRLAYQDDEIKQLTDRLLEQRRELDELRLDVERLKELVRSLAPSQVDGISDEPPPPHY